MLNRDPFAFRCLPGASKSNTENSCTTPEGFTRTAACGRERAATRSPCGLQRSTSGHEIHAGACAQACLVGKFASPRRSNFSPSNAKKAVPARPKILSLSRHKRQYRQTKAAQPAPFLLFARKSSIGCDFSSYKGNPRIKSIRLNKLARNETPAAAPIQNRSLARPVLDGYHRLMELH
jgi:hypothetical protein